MVETRTLQIATFGTDGQERIAAGIRNFPIHKLCLVCYNEDKPKADEFARKIKGILGIPITISLVTKENVIRDTMERIGEILKVDGKEYREMLMNVSCGDKLIGCAALSAAFVNGIKAFGTDESGVPLLMPVLKLSYNEVISDAKIKILRSIDNIGGSIDGLEQLEHASGYGKPLLSYHIMGSKDAKGLADLGLLEVERGDRGKITAKLSTLGKLLVTSNSITSTNP